MKRRMSPPEWFGAESSLRYKEDRNLERGHTVGRQAGGCSVFE